MSQPRPAGPEWWCSPCAARVQVVIIQKDTPEMLIDEVHCPNAHPTGETRIGTASVERTDRKELAASVTIEIRADQGDGLERQIRPRVIGRPS